jgi:drug/metabolite transporter (DMT)-like permease
VTPAHRPGLGIALMVGVAVSFATLDTMVKMVMAVVPVLVILWVRYTFQALTMGAWLATRPGTPFRSRQPFFQIVRGVLLLATSALAWSALKWLPVAEFTAINMLAPVLVTLLAATVLRERVSRRRWALVALAFGGGLLIVRPGSGLYGAATLLPLAAALCYACFQVLTSRLASLEEPTTTHFYTGLVGAAILTPMVVAAGIDVPELFGRLDALSIVLLLACGAAGTLGHLMLVFALGFAPAAALMPFLYTQIAAATLGGWLVFRQLPDGWAFAGMAVIAFSGAVSAWLNLRASRPAASPVAVDTVAE